MNKLFFFSNRFKRTLTVMLAILLLAIAAPVAAKTNTATADQQHILPGPMEEIVVTAKPIQGLPENWCNYGFDDLLGLEIDDEDEACDELSMSEQSAVTVPYRRDYKGGVQQSNS